MKPLSRPKNWPAASVEMWAIDRLKAYARNARTHSAEQVAQIAASMREWGFTVPILAQPDGTIIAGHGRHLAAQQLGLAEVPVMIARGWTEAQVRAYVLADNKLAANAGWDEDLLKIELGELSAAGFDVGITGFSDEELAAINAIGAGAGRDPDEVPQEPPRIPVTQPGDLWHLGSHRLLCGDSTKTNDVARVLDGARASLLFTSPPYGNQRDYTTGGIGDWDALMQGVFGRATDAMTDDGQVLVNLGVVHRDNEWQPYWQDWLDWMRGEGWRRFGLYVWDQGPGLPGDWNGRLAPAFEFIFHFNRQPRKPNKTVESKHAGETLGGGGLRGADGTVHRKTGSGNAIQSHRIPDSVFRIMRHKGGLGAAGSHPAVFPVALPEFVMNAYSDAGAVVFEPFAGSGTTTIAGERTGRRVRAIELAPAYVDIAIQRWQAFAGGEARLEASGKTYDETMHERYDANADGLGSYEVWMAEKRKTLAAAE